MEQYTRVGTPIQIMIPSAEQEHDKFQAGVIVGVRGGKVDVAWLDTRDWQWKPMFLVSHWDFYKPENPVQAYWRHIPQAHCHSEGITTAAETTA